MGRWYAESVGEPAGVGGHRIPCRRVHTRPARAPRRPGARVREWIQLWHLVVLLVPVVLALLLYAVVRTGVRHGMQDHREDRGTL
ncbi:hypothetical protein [Ornithinimicrobium pekingense]|uniref:Cardiolipin synthase N-terminal domain-containing protein n=1 Tax=Ornithinimicrobium pekingense TaxID=384677 RepID=A0ABQ2F629_9MICO|nr:hypothetical protein [Ornithinimicrobium pekingense]GGK57303.1 hypothetical protein GCM10011509_02090 [Ornithinimicrobium pekingense]